MRTHRETTVENAAESEFLTLKSYLAAVRFRCDEKVILESHRFDRG